MKDVLELGGGRGWENGELNRINLDYLEKTFSKNMDLDACASEDWGMKSSMGKNHITLKHTSIVTNRLRGTNSKGSAGEEGNQEHGFGNWGEEDPCYEVAESLLESPAVIWKGQKFMSM